MPQGFIPQAGVIPFRQGDRRIEICLITSTGGNYWGFPKGIVDGGDTPPEAALNEALEEAGLHGQIVGEPLGNYRYEKWDAELEVTMYLMEVYRSDEDWEESGIRERAWLSAEEALERLDRKQLRQLLVVALGRFE